MHIPGASKIAGVAFLALFPAFYFYHFAAAEEVFPTFLAGWHGPMTVIFVAPLMVAFTLFMQRHRLSLFGDWMSGGTVIFLAYATVWMLINIAITPEHPAHAELATTILALSVYFLVGAMLNPSWTPFRFLIMLSWAIMLVLSLEFVTVGSQVLMTVLQTETGSPLYQGLARSMMLVAMLAAAIQRNILLRVTVAILSVVALFVLGARSELYGFIAAYGMVEFFANRRSVFGLAVLGIAGIAMVAFVLSYFDFLDASRQMLVFNLGADESWRVRQYFERLAWQQIVESPIFGIYGGHWEVQEGGYAHNALSAWVSLGVVGFLLYVALSVLAAWRSLSAILADPNSPLARLAFMVASSALLLVILAKPLFWAMPALAWGLNTRPVPKRSAVAGLPA